MDETEVTDDALIHGYGQSAGRSRLLDHSEVGGRARIDGAAAPPAKRVSACCALMFSNRDKSITAARACSLVSGRSISLRKKFKPQNL
jgi:hypothetical protein